MSHALNGSSAIRCFEGSNAIEVRDGITFNFYTGLPHMHGGALEQGRPVNEASSGVHIFVGNWVILFLH